MTNENKETEKNETNHTTENLESVGQIIVGEIEAIGGILTGDPLTRAEGEFNVQVGSLHQESNKVLTAVDNRKKEQGDKPENFSQTEVEE